MRFEQRGNGSSHLTGGLRRVIEAACEEAGSSLSAMTVLAAQNDPFRVDTPAGHRDGEWLASEADRLGLGDRTDPSPRPALHARLGRVGQAEWQAVHEHRDDWVWLQNDGREGGALARLHPFEQIIDARNAEPVDPSFERPTPWPY